jgi:hypothetical protein
MNWLERVKIEREELQDKINKLTTFLHSPEFDNLTNNEKVNLAIQHYNMQGYLQTLTRRVDQND